MSEPHPNRRELYSEIAKAVVSPDEPIAKTQLASPVANTPEVIEQRLIEALTGGEQNRRNFLKRIGALVGAASLCSANALPVTEQKLPVEEALALLRASRAASGKITIMNHIFPDHPGRAIPEMIFNGGNEVLERMQLSRLDQVLGTDFWHILDIRNARSIEKACHELEGIIKREELNQKNIRKLYEYIERAIPDKNPYYLLHPPFPHHEERIAEDTKKFIEDSVRESKNRPFFYHEPSADKMKLYKENLALLRDYLSHYTRGTLEEFVERKYGPGSYPHYKECMAGKDYRPRAKLPEDRQRYHREQLEEFLEKDFVVESTLGKGPQAHKVIITSDTGYTHPATHHLHRLAELIPKAFPGSRVTEYFPLLGSNRCQKSETIGAPCIVIEDPPYALAVTLEKHVKGSVMRRQ